MNLTKKFLVASLTVGATVGALQCIGGQSFYPFDTIPTEVGTCTEAQGCAKWFIGRTFWNWGCGPCHELDRNCTQCFEPLCNGAGQLYMDWAVAMISFIVANLLM